RARRARRARGRRPPPAPRALRLPRQLGGGMIRFGLNVGYSGAQLSVDMDLVREAERLGFHSVWTAEAYGSDAVTPLAWIGGQTSRIRLGSAIMQMAARTPAVTASTATSLDQLSGGRFLLGLGVSGPQVVEGWHGQPCLDFVKPMLALYIGGMGARGKNFYNELACRYGFEAAAKKIQDLYLDGKKAEATAAVPNELADEVSLVGPPGRIRARLAA